MPDFTIETKTTKNIKTKAFTFPLDEGETLKDNPDVMALADLTVPMGKKVEARLILVVLKVEDK